MLFIAEADESWKTLTEDGNYLNAVLSETRKRTYFLSYTPNYYLVGYGDAASLAHQWAMKKPSKWAGLVTYGELHITDQFMIEVENKPSDLPYIPMGELPLPVWCFMSSFNEQALNVVDYWKRANNSYPFPYSNQYARYVYFPSRVYRYSEMNDQNIARVLLTIKENRLDNDFELMETVWGDFLNTTRRYIGIANGDLRAYIDPEKMGYVKKHVTVDGYRREWYEYVPKSVKAAPDRIVPLVVAMHRRSGVNRELVGRSGWSQVAEDRDFIVVFPTSNVRLINETAVPNTVWNITKDPNGVDDVKFIRMMIEDIKANHNIDDSRAYSSG
jgi:hypothetical protein